MEQEKITYRDKGSGAIVSATRYAFNSSNLSEVLELIRHITGHEVEVLTMARPTIIVPTPFNKRDKAHPGDWIVVYNNKTICVMDNEVFENMIDVLI